MTDIDYLMAGLLIYVREADMLIDSIDAYVSYVGHRMCTGNIVSQGRRGILFWLIR